MPSRLEVATLIVSVLAGIVLFAEATRGLAPLRYGFASFAPSLRQLLWPALVLGMSLLVLYGLRRRRLALTERRRVLAEEGSRAFEADGKPGWVASALAVYAAGAIALWAAAEDGGALLAGASLVLVVTVGAGLAQMATRMLRRGPTLRIDAHGIDHALYGPIPWSVIAGLDLRRGFNGMGSDWTLMLRVHDPAPFLAHAPSLFRWMHRLDRQRDLPLSLAFLDVDGPEVHRAALAFCPAVRPVEAGVPALDARSGELHALMEEMARLEVRSDRQSAAAGMAADAKLEALHARMQALTGESSRAADALAAHTRRLQRRGRITLAVALLLGIALVAVRLLR